MRTFWLWAGVAGLPLLWLVSLWLLLRDWIPSTGTLSDRINFIAAAANLLTLILGLVGLFIAVTSYRQSVAVAAQQAEDSKQQAQTLTDQRDALNASKQALQGVVVSLGDQLDLSRTSLSALREQVDITQRQQEMSRKSLSALQAQLAIAEQQQAEERARLARRPKLEVDVGSYTWNDLQQGKEITVTFENDRLKATFFVRNVGDAVLYKTVALVGSDVATVKFEPRQWSGITAQDLVPFSQSESRYKFETTISIPHDLERFSLTFRIFGENAATTSITIPILVRRRSPSDQPEQPGSKSQNSEGVPAPTTAPVNEDVVDTG